MAEAIAGIAIPDSRMAQETTTFICDTETPLLYHHSRRTYLFGMLHGVLRGQSAIQNCCMSPRCSMTSGWSMATRTFVSDSRSMALMPHESS
jgi:hypothetical protein